ncbi:hypothetical protein IVB22_39430 [Bradyrhizobium sp. 190]|uniref:hypothetical protein n=1 Tax=Bradyrhizobium sp. 190 TaxID=2782658 RepID=UPI001FF7DDFF|nr:hypothetical protein [Bradyrhizobium sp. 190]MCK1518440.1 hypothetical protein [Bradyrhizobium sp. 190]
MERAAELASIVIDNKLVAGDDVRQSTFLTIQKARQAIDDGAGAAKGQELLLDAVRSAEQWVRFACSEADRQESAIP